MRIVFVAIVFIFTKALFAQDPYYVFEDTVNTSPVLKISSFNYYTSNKLTLDFTDKFLFGGVITQDIKDRNQKRLRNLNVLGAESEQRIDSYTPDINPLKREKYGLLISFSDNHFVSANIPTALYNTAMYGNADYLGDTMNFHFAHAQYQHYQKFSVGFYEKKTMSSIQVSYVAGSKGFDYRLADTWMLSDANSDSIYFNLSGDGFQSGSFYPYWAFNGGGFALDFNYNFLFSDKKENQQIVNLRISNVGVIFWNRTSTTYYVDTVRTYSGFQVQDLLKLDSSSYDGFSFQDTLGIKQATQPYTDVLPIELVVQKLPDQSSPKKIQSIFGFKAILTTDYFPYLYAGAYYKASDNFSLSSRLSYGGFGGFKWGVNANYWAGDKFYLSVGSYDLLGFLAKNIANGRSINLSMYVNL